jgi:hypothetical protein
MPGTEPAASPGMEPPPGVGEINPNEIATVSLMFRAVSLTQVSPSANTDLAYALLEELKQDSRLFEPKGTQFSTEILPDEATGTFTFGVTLALKQPLKL